MKNRTVGVFSFFIILTFILALLCFVGNIVYDMQTGSAKADEHFKELLFNMDKQVARTPYLSAEYLTKLQTIIQKEDAIAAVTIKSESATHFAFPLTSSYISVNAVSPEIFASSPLIKVCSQNVSYSESVITSVNAAVYLVTPRQIYVYAFRSFVIIFAGTVLCFIVLAFYLQAVKKAQKNEETPDIAKDSPKEETVPANEPCVFEDRLKTDSEQTRVVRTIDPLGLFSPSTGLSWESYLETRLDADLVRAASSEQDLSLIYIRVVDVSHNHPCAKQIANVLLEHFKFRDLIFEFGTDGYVCILQNYNLNQALTVSEKLYKDLNALLAQFNLESQCAFGISTRALRLITGIRLMKEALQAVEKALEEPELPIVAFKVNAERYRKFLSEELSRVTV